MRSLPTQEEPIQVPENNQADDEPKQWERLFMDEITPNPLHPRLADILPLCRYEDLYHISKQVV